MKKATKLTLIFGIIVIGVILFFAGVSRLLAPAFVKAELSRQVYQLTGHSLIVNGNVSWTFFPWVGISVHKVVLNNRDEFGKTPLAEAESIQLNVKLIPLLSRHVEVGTIHVNGLNLFLTKNFNGQTNWAHFFDAGSPKENQRLAETENKKFNIHQIDVINFKHGKILFHDEQKHKSMELTNLNFATKNIAINKAFPFNLSFNFAQKPASYSGDIKLQGELTVDDAQNRFDFSSLNFDSHFKDAKEKTSTVNANCNLVYERKNARFSIRKLTAKLNEHSFNGDLAGTFRPSFSAQGHLYSTALFVGGFLFKNVETRLDIKNAILALKPLTANLYEGDYTGDILIDMRPSIPTVALNGMLKKANASLLFTNIMQKNNYPFTGALDMSTMLKFTLGEPYTLRKTLNGNITIRLQNGVLHGINIPALIELGQAFLKQTALPPVAKNQTDFGVMKGTFQIQNGVMVNQDLTLQSSELTATGWGKINLVDEKIDYHLKAGLVGHQTAVPILIRGNIDHPMVMPDTEQLATETLKEHVNRLKDKLKEKYGDKLKTFNLASLLG